MTTMLLIEDGATMAVQMAKINANFQLLADTVDAQAALIGALEWQPLDIVTPSRSPTYLDLTGIPAEANQISLGFSQLWLTGIDSLKLRLGSDAGGFETTNYFSTYSGIRDATSAAQSMTDGFGIRMSGGAPNGVLMLTRMTGNTWGITGNLAISSEERVAFIAGYKSLSSPLSKIRVMTAEATTFVGTGSVSINWRK